MSRSIIAGIRSAAKGFIDPEMETFYHSSEEEDAQWKALEKLVEPLNSDLAEKILVCAVEIKAVVDVNAFTDGFRMATELIMESLRSQKDSAARERQEGGAPWSKTT